MVGPLVGGARQPVGLLRRDIVGGTGDGLEAGRAVVAALGPVEAGDGHGAVADRRGRSVHGLQAAHGDELALARALGDFAVGGAVAAADVVHDPLEAGVRLLVLEDEEEGGPVLREVGRGTGAGDGRDLHDVGRGVDDRLFAEVLVGGARGEPTAAEGEEREEGDGGEQTHGELQRPETAGSGCRDRKTELATPGGDRCPELAGMTQ